MANKRYVVELTKFAAKQVGKLPSNIRDGLMIWMDSVQSIGLPGTRRLKGYHDEPLKGHRTGQRSIRLNRSYRVIYEEDDQGSVVVIGVLEVNKHDYR